MRIFTGIKPTGVLHIGNYFGSIKQLLDYQTNTKDEIIAFIANAHALTVPVTRAEYELHIKNLLAGYLAAGIDPERICLYKQTDVPEIFELAWLLACFCTKGVLDRAHAYKAYKDAKDNQDDIMGVGIYTYPILMAADILGAGADIVPVGPDQKQHVEICRDLAIKINHHISANNHGGFALSIPEPRIQQEQNIIGLDGRKMSKSYSNTIGLFESTEALKKLIYGIKTDSSSPKEPKSPETLFQLYEIFATTDEIEQLAHKYQTGIGWAEVKQIVYDKIEEFIAPIRAKHAYYMEHEQGLQHILKMGANKIRPITQNITDQLLHHLGL